MQEGYRFERLSQQLEICVSAEHRFGTDAFLLAHFCGVRATERACDLGTGCGIIPMLWLRDARPCQICAVEIQPQAIGQLQLTLEHCGLQGEITPLCMDLRDLPALRAAVGTGSMDVVSCNPPYKACDTGIPSAGDAQLIARHEVCCTIADVCAAAAAILRYGGRLCLCHRPERLADVFDAMRRHKIEPKRLRMVQQRHGEAPWLVLVEGRLGGRPHLRIEPSLTIEDEGRFGEELLRIYGKLRKEEEIDER